MRHRKKFNHLSRKSSHRKLMLSNMATSLIMHKRITTTVAKAKALRQYVEPIITKSKNDSTHSRRTVFRYLGNKYAVSELFREVATKIAERPGGYTRILKTGQRAGDNAEMCIIELVDYNENMLEAKETTQKSTRRSRRRRKKQTSDASPPPVQQHEDTREDENAEQAQQQKEKEADENDAEAVNITEEAEQEPVEEATADENQQEEVKSESEEDTVQESKSEEDTQDTKKEESASKDDMKESKPKE